MERLDADTPSGRSRIPDHDEGPRPGSADAKARIVEATEEGTEGSSETPSLGRSGMDPRNDSLANRSFAPAVFEEIREGQS
jgi:hypothetical protein